MDLEEEKGIDFSPTSGVPLLDGSRGKPAPTQVANTDYCIFCGRELARRKSHVRDYSPGNKSTPFFSFVTGLFSKAAD